ncbi:MAG TPA: DUF1116 domain-containing protein [Nocardioidaceae bacterium]|nr:DUF1116 domain-containing protein [Nocardioidaceae bacterium]
MSQVSLTTPDVVVTAGAAMLADAVEQQGVTTARVDWRPPVEGTEHALVRVVGDQRRREANAKALEAMLAAEAVLVDVRPASEALGLERGQFLHAGPPVEWERASGPMRGALMGAALFEGLAGTPDEAEKMLASGDGVSWEPCHHHGAVGPMAGVVSPSMWMFELRDEAHDNTSWCSLNEGLGKVLRYGAYGPEVVERLHWMTEVLGPILQSAVRAGDPVDVKAIIGQMVQMGDEGHNRNRAGTLMLLRELLPGMIESGHRSGDIAESVRFVAGNDHFFLNLGMPACKLQTSAAAGIDGSTVVTVMARNGTDFGIQVSGTGDRWFTAPANTPEGLFLGSYGPEDANPDIGDSAITETAGIGGFAMATAPAIVRFVGGSVPDALATSQRMYDITVGENPAFAIPILEFRGAPTGIDVTAVVRTGVLPQINTGMAGRVAGTGQVGAGLVTPPMACFTEAIEALAEAAPEGP